MSIRLFDFNDPGFGLLFNTMVPMFQLLFERSTDAIVLFDPQAGVIVNCNAAAVDLMRAGTKEKLLQVGLADLEPPFQPDGRPSLEKSAEITALVQRNGSHRFEWVARWFDNTEVHFRAQERGSASSEAERDPGTARGRAHDGVARQ
jgi:PAS domain-containing protein